MDIWRVSDVGNRCYQLDQTGQTGQIGHLTKRKKSLPTKNYWWYKKESQRGYPQQ